MQIPCWISHNYNRITVTHVTVFKGLPLIETVNSEFKVCSKCGALREFNYDSQGGSWSKLPKNREDIILRNIENNHITYPLK